MLGAGSSRAMRCAGWLAMVLVAALATDVAWGQAAPTAASTPSAADPRPLAEGVMRIVPALPEPADTVDRPVALPELAAAAAGLQWTPKTLPASEVLVAELQSVTMRRPVWQLEFGYKPLRTMRVNLRQPDGSSRSTVVWYLIYFVRNAGGRLDLVAEAPDPAGYQKTTLRPSQGPARFLPAFVLEGFDPPRTYPENIVPAAVAQIQARELPGGTLHDSVSIGRVNLPPSTDPGEGKVWGVATWIGVDPRTDFFAAHVQGLTNGYQIATDGEAGSRRLKRTLRLNFWRPGDAIDTDRDEIHFGIPYFDDPDEQAAVLELLGVDERLDFEWVYR